MSQMYLAKSHTINNSIPGPSVAKIIEPNVIKLSIDKIFFFYVSKICIIVLTSIDKRLCILSNEPQCECCL